MAAIRAIFDGTVFVPISNVDLPTQTEVEVIVATPAPGLQTCEPSMPPRRKFGMARSDQFWMSPDFDATPEDFKDYL